MICEANPLLRQILPTFMTAIPKNVTIHQLYLESKKRLGKVEVRQGARSDVWVIITRIGKNILMSFLHLAHLARFLLITGLSCSPGVFLIR